MVHEWTTYIHTCGGGGGGGWLCMVITHSKGEIYSLELLDFQSNIFSKQIMVKSLSAIRCVICKYYSDINLDRHEQITEKEQILNQSFNGIIVIPICKLFQTSCILAWMKDNFIQGGPPSPPPQKKKPTANVDQIWPNLLIIWYHKIE